MILYAYVANGGTLGEPTATIAYGYEVENQAWADQLTSYNGEAIRYDASGNPTTYRGYTMTWQGRRLTGATGNGNTLSYSYDENGLRTQKTVNGTATQYRYHGSVLISQVTGNDTLLFSYGANGNVVAVNYNGTYYYYVRNGQDDIIRLIDGSNNTVVEYSYDSWGRLLSCTGSLASTLGTQNPFRYRGYVYDTETGLYYLQTRYYDPEVGRFINADGYVSTGQGVLGHNMYAYCLNGPMNRKDTVGNRAVWNRNGGYDENERDVTDEINVALFRVAKEAEAIHKLVDMIGIFTRDGYFCGRLNIYIMFKDKVDHKKPWDIKRDDQWESTIGTSYPGYDTSVIYRGKRVTPENLGNITYGYLGAAYGIPLVSLIGGSYYAAGFPTDEAGLKNEVGDWQYVWTGYMYYFSDCFGIK